MSELRDGIPCGHRKRRREEGGREGGAYTSIRRQNIQEFEV